MLKNLRKKKIKKTVWIILAVLIVPAFVLWGSSSLVSDKEEPSSAGRISGRNIPLLEYKDAMDAVKAQMIMQFGDKYSEVQRSLDMNTLAWGQINTVGGGKKAENQSKRQRSDGNNRRLSPLSKKRHF
jgi:hypothetical protein